MSNPHFIHLTGTNALFMRESRSMLSIEASITRNGDGDDDALARFRHQLLRFPSDDFVFVVDSVNEELVAEEVPRLRARDLKAMMARRVEQRTREKKLATWRSTSRRSPWPARALPSGNPASTPNTESLVMGLLGTDGIQPWLDVATAAKARVADVLSPALLASGIAHRLRRDAPHGLLAMVTPAGLRQTLIVDGQVRFTRLARLAETGADSASIAAECTRTIQYLLMNQAMSRAMLATQQSRVWIVTDGILDPQGLPARLKADSAGEIEVRRVRADELGARRVKGPLPLGLGSAHLLADARLVATAGRGYASPALRNRHVAARLARTIVGTGLAFATAGALALGGVELHAALDVEPIDPMDERRLQAHREMAELLQRYDVPGTEMRRVVELDERLRARAVDPLVPLQRIALAMKENPGVRLERLSWARTGVSAASNANETGASVAPDMNTAAPGGNALPGAAQVPGAGAVAPVATVATVPLADARGTSPAGTDADAAVDFRIEARVEPLGRKEQANATARRFLESLGRHCGCETRLLTPPFDPSPASGFSADLKSPDSNAKAEFLVTLRYLPTLARRSGGAR